MLFKPDAAKSIDNWAAEILGALWGWLRGG